MSKSKDNSILPAELFIGSNPIMSKAYSPMVVRFFMLQAHYRSILNITEKGLADAEKGYNKLMEAYHVLKELKHEVAENLTADDQQINKMLDLAFAAMNDDMNTAAALAKLNVVIPKINSITRGKLDIASISKATLQRMQQVFKDFIFDIFGLLDETKKPVAQNEGNLMDDVMQLIIELRQEARSQKDYATSDLIRNKLQDVGIKIKDDKEGASWSKSQ